MKQIFSLLMAAMLFMTTACADDHVTTDASCLPGKAQQYLKHFEAPIALIEVDNDGVFGKTYDVKLNDGTEIDFDKNGEWKSVDTERKPVPVVFIPKTIADYIKANYSQSFVSKIDKDSRGYDVELSNHLELKFDSNGKFLRLDD